MCSNVEQEVNFHLYKLCVWSSSWLIISDYLKSLVHRASLSEMTVFSSPVWCDLILTRSVCEVWAGIALLWDSSKVRKSAEERAKWSLLRTPVCETLAVADQCFENVAGLESFLVQHLNCKACILWLNQFSPDGSVTIFICVSPS